MHIIETFMSLRVGLKIVLGFFMMVLFMGFIGFTAYSGLNHTGKAMEQLFGTRMTGIENLVEAGQLIDTLRD